MPFLTVQPSQGKRYQIPFDRDLIRVGRSSRNEIHLSFDPSLSRFHAEFSRTDNQFYVRDVGSRNGTSVNGQPLAEAVALRPGDRVSLGETVIYFTLDRESAVEITDRDGMATPGQNTVVMQLGEIITSPVELPGLPRHRPSGEVTTPQGRAFTVLSRAANEMLSHRTLDQTLELVMDMVFEALSPDRGVVMLLEGAPPVLEARVIREARSRSGNQIQISRAIIDAVVQGKQSILTTDAQQDARFSARESIQLQGIQAALCVPLWNNRDVIGLVYVDTLGAPGRFQKDDLRMLTMLANLAAVKIENVRLFEKEQRMQMIEKELEAASQIQRRLLPGAPPILPGFQITGYNSPCREVGGDYYDFVPRGEGRLGIAIGDVSGKGMGAALLMATLQATFRAHVGLGLPVPELVARLNQAVAAAAMSNKFISFFYGELEASSGVLKYANAGHNPPILLRSSGEVEHLRAGGMILGILPTASYVAREVTVHSGDVLILFSDGITESQNESEEEFGEERLIAALRDCREGDADRIREHLEEAVDAFVGKAAQFDDVTLCVVKRV